MNCPHCGKPVALVTLEPKAEERTEPEASPLIKRRERKMLAIKSPFPKKGESWDWHVRYFNEGDPITWRQRCGANAGKVLSGIVTKVTRNSFGRISYATESQKFIMTEEVMEAQT